MNAMGEGFLAITVAGPLTKTPIHISIEETSTNNQSFLFDSDLRDICETIQAQPYVNWAQRVGYSPINYEMVGFPEDTTFHDEIRIVSGNLALAANETYIDIRSPNAASYTWGSRISVPIKYFTVPWSPNTSYLNVTVVGFVELSSATRNIALDNLTIPYGVWGEEPLFPRPEEVNDILVTSWELTLQPLMEHYSSQGYHSSIDGRVLVNLNLNQILSPADVAGTIATLQQIDTSLNQLLLPWNMQTRNYVRDALERIRPFGIQLVESAAIASLLIFGLAMILNYEIGKTLINLRHREFGLLLAKGMSNKRLIRMQLIELIFLATVAMITAIFIGPLLGSLILMLLGYPPQVALTLAPWPVLLLTFGLILVTLLLPIVIELRGFLQQPVNSILTADVLSLGPVRRSVRITLWLLLLLGGYRLFFWLFGIPFPSLVLDDILYQANIPIGLIGGWLFTAYLYFDIALTVLGPVFFIVGFVGLFIIYSQQLGRFAQITAQRLFGYFGQLASRDFGIRRRQMGSMVLLLLLVFSFVVSTIGLLTSEMEFQHRSLATDIGADVRVELQDLTNLTTTLQGLQGLEGVEGVTPIMFFKVRNETSFHPAVSSTFHFLAIDPQTWLSTAYYEEGWFVGDTPENFMTTMQESPDTVLFTSYLIAEENIGFNRTFSIYPDWNPNGTLVEMTVIGFMTVTPFWPNIMSWDSALTLYNLSEDSEPAILLKLEPFRSQEQIQAQINALDIPNLLAVRFFSEELSAWRTMPLARAFLDFQRLAIIGAILLWAIGTVVMVEYALSQRTDDLRILHIRGVRRTSVRKVLLIEFGVIGILVCGLGLFVGIITTYGITLVLNRLFLGGVPRRLVFEWPAQFFLLLSIIIVLALFLIPLLYRTHVILQREQLVFREG